MKIVSKSKDTCLSFKVESVKGYRKLRGREEQKLIQFGLITFKTVKDQITKHFFLIKLKQGMIWIFHWYKYG